MLHKRQQKANKIKQPPIDGIKITSRNERGKYLGILERDSFKQERCNERKKSENNILMELRRYFKTRLNSRDKGINTNV